MPPRTPTLSGIVTEQPEWMTRRGFYEFLTTDFLGHTIPAPPEPNPGAKTRYAVGLTYDQVSSDLPNYMATVTEEF